MGDLSDVHPVATARARLLTRERVTSLLGDPEQIGTHNEPPYPCVVLSDPPGNDRYARHLIAPVLQVEVIGDLDGTPGKPMLRKILYRVIEELVAFAESEQTDPTQPVVTGVVPSGGGGYVPLPNGQPRYLATVTMYMHPPLVTP